MSEPEAIRRPAEPEEHLPGLALPGHGEDRAGGVGQRARGHRAGHLAARHELGEAAAVLGDQPVGERGTPSILKRAQRALGELDTTAVAVAAIVGEQVRLGRDGYQAAALVVIVANAELLQVEPGTVLALARASPR